jgi:hypothetical protein
MANGFDGSNEDWQRLEAPLLEVDDHLAGFARAHNFRFVKNAQNWPNRRIEWDSGKIHRCIQITVTNDAQLPRAHIGLLARVDRNRKRYLRNELLRRDSSWAEISDSLGALLEEARATLESWSEDTLKYATDLRLP